MDEKKINHIETSSRASSAANFNSIDIDLRSNFDLSIPNFRFDAKKSNTEGFLKVKSAKKEKSLIVNKVNKKDISSENISTSTETPSTQSQHIYSILLSNDIKKVSLDRKDSRTEKIKKIKKFVIPGIMLSSLVLVIGVILGLIAAFGGNFLSNLSLLTKAEHIETQNQYNKIKEVKFLFYFKCFSNAIALLTIS